MLKKKTRAVEPAYEEHDDFSRDDAIDVPQLAEEQQCC
jgi:hypothetical protein